MTAACRISSASLNVSKVLHAYIKGEPIDLAALTQDGSLLPETLNGLELLNHFRTHSEHMVLVVDEYGELRGLVTQQDLLETLAGDFQQEDGEDNWAFQRADGSWLLDGLIPLPELKDCLELVRLPEEENITITPLEGLSCCSLAAFPRPETWSPWNSGNWKSWIWTACASTRYLPCP